MELNFVETIEGKEWVAEFEAPSDFNLHLERNDSGSLVVSQRGTPSGEYDVAFVKGSYEGGMVIDYDFGALVYPKYIKVVSGSEVVSASVNFNEGGGSGSGSGDSNISYYKVKQDWTTAFNNDDTLIELCYLASRVKSCEVNSNSNPIGIIVDSFYNTSENNRFLGFAFMPVIGTTEESSYDSLEDGVNKGFIPPIDHVVEPCTSDEFYNKKPIHKFRIHIHKDIYTGNPTIIGENNYAVKEYDFEVDMSLDEWLNSKYNIDNLTKYANSNDTYIYAPYIDNGEKAFLLEGHGYNPLQYDKPYMFRFFNSIEVDTDEGKVLTHLGFNPDNTSEQL